MTETCNEVIEFLDAYVGGELDPGTRTDFDDHIATCASCRAYLASYEETIDLVRGTAAREEELAHDAPPELIEAMKRGRR